MNHEVAMCSSRLLPGISLLMCIVFVGCYDSGIDPLVPGSNQEEQADTVHSVPAGSCLVLDGYKGHALLEDRYIKELEQTDEVTICFWMKYAKRGWQPAGTLVYLGGAGVQTKGVYDNQGTLYSGVTLCSYYGRLNDGVYRPFGTYPYGAQAMFARQAIDSMLMNTDWTFVGITMKGNGVNAYVYGPDTAPYPEYTVYTKTGNQPGSFAQYSGQNHTYFSVTGVRKALVIGATMRDSSCIVGYRPVGLGVVVTQQYVYERTFGEYFKGSLDDVMIFNRVLSEQDMAHIAETTYYTSPDVSQLPPGLVACYAFDSTGTDGSHHGYDLTLSGTAEYGIRNMKVFQ